MPRPSYAHNQLNGNLSARVDLTLPNFEDGYVPPPLHLSYNSQCKGAYRYMGFELADGWVLSTLPLLAGDRQQLIPHIEEGHSCLSTCDADGFVTIFYQCVDTSSYRATPGELSRLVWTGDFVWREQKADGTIIEYARDPYDPSRALPRWIRVDLDVIEIAFSQYDGGDNLYNQVDFNYLHAGKGYPVTLQRAGASWTVTDWNEEVTTLTVSGGKLTKVEDTRTGTLAECQYGAQGLTKLIDPDNYDANFSYSASSEERHFGELTSFTDAENHTTNLTFNLDACTSTGTNARTATWQYEHDGQVLTKSTDPGPHNGVSEFEYANTADDYEGEHYLLHERDPNGTLGSYWNFQYAYDGNGNRSEVTDGEGVTTYYWYNDDRKVIGTRVGPPGPNDPSPNPGDPAPGAPNPQPTELGPYAIYQYVEVEQSFPGGYYGTQTGGGWRTHSNYGGFRPLIRIRNILSGEYQTSYEYDSYGRVIAEIDPRGYVTRYEYYRLDADYFRKRRTDPLGNQTCFDYDKEGDLVRELDPVECETLTEYDKRHLPKLVTNPFGHTRSMDYDHRGNLLEEKNWRGYTPEHVYDGLSRDVLTRFPLELPEAQRAVTQNHYDSAGNLDWSEDANLHRTNYQYYDTNWLKLTKDADNNEVENFYDPGGRLERVEDPRNDPTEHDYDKADKRTKTRVWVNGGSGYQWVDRAVIQHDGVGRVKEVKDGENAATGWEYDRVNRTQVVKLPMVDDLGQLTTDHNYDPNGNQTYWKDANDKVSRAGHDALNRLEWVRNQKNEQTNYKYENVGSQVLDGAVYFGGGVKVTLTDPRENETIEYHDCLGRLVGVRDAKLEWALFQYDENGNRTAVRDRNKNWTYYGYDEFDRLVWVTQPTKTATTDPDSLPKAEKCQYDNNGNLTVLETPRATTGAAAWNKTEYEYDQLDRRTKVKRHNGPSVLTWETQYDDANNKRTEIDPLGASDQTEYWYDALGRLRYVQWTEDSTTCALERRYDKADNLVLVIDAASKNTSWEYDAMNRANWQADHGGNKRQFEYDGVGRVTKRTDAENRVTDYQHDDAWREKERSYSGAGKVETLEYDKNGNRKRVKTALGEWEWTYDELNRMVGRNEPPIGIADPNHGPIATSWHYDANGNLICLEGPDAWGSTDYDYDERNRLTKVTRKSSPNDPNPRVTEYEYYENNLLKLKQLPNGTEMCCEYDELDRLTKLVNRKSDDTVISSFDIEYRNDGLKSKVTREDDTEITYQYDSRKRLIEEKWTASDQSVPHKWEYTYNKAGFRLTKTYNGTTTTYTPNDLHQVTQEQTGADTTAYQYDKDGNTTSKTDPVRETTYTWDHENMLLKAEFDDASTTNAFKYDMDSLRIEKVDDSGTKQYHRSGLNDVMERSGETVERIFVHGMKPLPGVGSLLQMEEGSSILTYHLGPFGNVRQLTDASENVTKNQEFEAFGTRPAGEGDAHSGRGFVSHELDEDTDLLAFPGRMYDAATGRFLSRDPAQSDISLYDYAAGDPVNWLDPSGLVRIRNRQTELVFNHWTRMFRFIDRDRGIDRWYDYGGLRKYLLSTGASPHIVNVWVERAKKERGELLEYARAQQQYQGQRDYLAETMIGQLPNAFAETWSEVWLPALQETGATLQYVPCAYVELYETEEGYAYIWGDHPTYGNMWGNAARSFGQAFVPTDAAENFGYTYGLWESGLASEEDVVVSGSMLTFRVASGAALGSATAVRAGAWVETNVRIGPEVNWKELAKPVKAGGKGYRDYVQAARIRIGPQGNEWIMVHRNMRFPNQKGVMPPRMWWDRTYPKYKVYPRAYHAHIEGVPKGYHHLPWDAIEKIRPKWTAAQQSKATGP